MTITRIMGSFHYCLYTQVVTWITIIRFVHSDIYGWGTTMTLPPSGFTWVAPSNVIALQDSTTSGTWDVSRTACMTESPLAHLAFVQDQAALSRYSTRNDHWVGYRRFDGTGSWWDARDVSSITVDGSGESCGVYADSGVTAGDCMLSKQSLCEFSAPWCPLGWSWSDTAKSCFVVYTAQQAFDTAQSECQAKGHGKGHLAHITTSAIATEITTILSLSGGPGQLWIGLKHSAGDPVWTDGRRYDGSTTLAVDQCAHVGLDAASEAAAACTEEMGYICQFKPDLRDNIASSSLGGACALDTEEPCYDVIDGDLGTHVTSVAGAVMTIELGAAYVVSAVRLHRSTPSVGTVNIAGVDKDGAALAGAALDLTASQGFVDHVVDPVWEATAAVTLTFATAIGDIQEVKVLGVRSSTNQRVTCEDIISKGHDAGTYPIDPTGSETFIRAYCEGVEYSNSIRSNLEPSFTPVSTVEAAYHAPVAEINAAFKEHGVCKQRTSFTCPEAYALQTYDENTAAFSHDVYWVSAGGGEMFNWGGGPISGGCACRLEGTCSNYCNCDGTATATTDAGDVRDTFNLPVKTVSVSNPGTNQLSIGHVYCNTKATCGDQNPHQRIQCGGSAATQATCLALGCCWGADSACFMATTKSVLGRGVFPKSCQEVQDRGWPNGKYVIDPTPDDFIPPFKVDCDVTFRPALTVAHHQLESGEHTYFRDTAAGNAFKFQGGLQYDATMEQLRNLVTSSQGCRQSIGFGGKSTGVTATVKWQNNDFTDAEQFTGNLNKCACKDFGNCVDDGDCNSDATGKDAWLHDSGIITDKTKLPIAAVAVGGQDGRMVVGPLICWRPDCDSQEVGGSLNADHLGATKLTASYNVLTDYVFSGTGKVRAWVFQVETPGTLYFAVMKPMGGFRYKLIGKNLVKVLAAGLNRVAIPDSIAVSVTRGDVIAVSGDGLATQQMVLKTSAVSDVPGAEYHTAVVTASQVDDVTSVLGGALGDEVIVGLRAVFQPDDSHQWGYDGGICKFKSGTTASTYADASGTCRAAGGFLPSIRSQQMMADINNEFSAAGETYFIGLSHEENRLATEDKYPLAYSKFQEHGFRHRVVCEGNTTELLCYDLNTTMRIHMVTYGRSSTTQCMPPEMFGPSWCNDPSVFLTVRDLCHGTRGCNVTAGPPTTPDAPVPPCLADDVMVLDILYDCVPTKWCENDFWLVGGSCYKVDAGPHSHQEAKLACSGMNARLASIEDDVHRMEVADKLTADVWISLRGRTVGSARKAVWAGSDRILDLSATDGACYTLAAGAPVPTDCSLTHAALCEIEVQPEMIGVYVDSTTDIWSYHNDTEENARDFVCHKGIDTFNPLECHVVQAMGDTVACPEGFPEVMSCSCGCQTYTIDVTTHECVCLCGAQVVEIESVSAICCSSSQQQGADRDLSLECSDAEPLGSVAGANFSRCPDAYPTLVSCPSPDIMMADSVTIPLSDVCIHSATEAVNARCCRLVDAPVFTDDPTQQFTAVEVVDPLVAHWWAQTPSLRGCMETCVKHAGCKAVSFSSGGCTMTADELSPETAAGTRAYVRKIHQDNMFRVSASSVPMTWEDAYLRDLASIVMSPDTSEVCYTSCYEHPDCMLAEFVNDTCYFGQNSTVCCGMATQFSVKRYFLDVVISAVTTSEWIQHIMVCSRSASGPLVSCACPSGNVASNENGVCTCVNNVDEPNAQYCVDNWVAPNAPPVCPPGNILFENHCYPCLEGNVTINLNSDLCETCPGKMIPDINGMSYCYNCPSGSIPDGYECVECGVGYETWFDGDPECHLLDCGPPYNVSDGHADYINTTFGAVAFYVCDPGTTLMNMSGLIMCSCSENWVGDNVTCHDIDECESNPCIYGNCTNQLDSYNCTCFPGYTGLNCETEIDECASTPCIEGTCLDLVDGFNCTCVLGYTGEICETDIDECASSPCAVGSTCNDMVDSFNCSCPLGHFGVLCELVVNCTDPPAEDFASYSPADGPYVYGDLALYACDAGYRMENGTAMMICSCNHNWMGDEFGCAEIDECESSPCTNDGTCNDLVNMYNCTCAPGWTGVNCEIDIDECLDQTCTNGQGECIDELNAYRCHCKSGFNGTDCEINIDECPGNECVTGTCVDDIAMYTCSCEAGWTGEFCEFDMNLDECLASPSVCFNEATCMDIEAGFECACAGGFTGETCETELDECVSMPCQHNGTCNDLINRFNCSCVPGYSGVFCQDDTNECGPPSPCLNGAVCIDMLAAYDCQCTEFYNGTTCADDVDECALTPPTCQNNGDCTNDVGSFTCLCPGSHVGTRCEFEAGANECLQTPCVHGQCGDLDVGYECTCSPGWLGMNCDEDINECLSSPCQHGGTCVNEEAKYTCQCVNGTEGANCETNIDDCAKGPCLNQATCNDHLNSYTCDCVPGWMGTLCDQDINECDSGPCQHDGTCTEGDVGEYNCECSVPWVGDSCEFDRNEDECLTGEPCGNGATCSDIEIGYNCSCAVGFSGYDCDIDIDDCQPGPCLNAGTCFDRVNSAICNCATGFTGDICQTDIDDCVGNTYCVNGDCVDGINTYSCACRAGFSGFHCDEGSNACEGEPCGNGGSCAFLAYPPFYRCDCLSNFQGENCTDVRQCADDPADIDLSTYVVNSPVYVIGALATYECDYGYHPEEPVNSKICRIVAGDLTEWVGTDIICKSIITANADSGVIEQPTVDPATGVMVQCEPIPAIDYSTIDNYDVTYASVVTITCTEGRQFHSNGRRQQITWCNASGKWEYQDVLVRDSCDIVTCPRIALPPTTTRNTFLNTFNTIVEYACAPGYRFSDGSTIRSTVCSKDGRWSAEIDFCLGPTCPELSLLTTGTLQHVYFNTVEMAYLDITPSPFTEHVNGSYQVTCPRNERLPNGQRRAITVCNKDDMWSPSRLDCAERCGPVWMLENSTVPVGYVTDLGEEVNVTCTPGHRFPDGSLHKQWYCMLMPNGEMEWGNDEDETLQDFPACKTVFCPVVPDVGYAVSDTNQNMVDTVVEYICDPTYMSTLTNETSFSITCIQTETMTKWSVAQPPDCIKIRCEPPPETTNATLEWNSEDVFLNDSALYRCADGARFADGRDTFRAFCLTNRRWTSFESDCEYNRCGLPPVIAASTVTHIQADRGGNVSYLCDLGHVVLNTMETEVTLICQDNLEWEASPGNCEEVLCPDLVDFARADGHLHVLTEAASHLYTAEVLVACETGYHFNVSQELIMPNATLTCMASGEWDVPLNDIECIIVRCPYIPPVGFTYGMRIVLSNVYLSTASYVCEQGYFFHNKRIWEGYGICQANGQWSFEPKFCEVVTCPAFQDWEDFEVNTTVNRYGVHVNYTCPNGTRFNDGVTSRVTSCDINGDWQPPRQECLSNVTVVQVPAEEAPGSTGIGAVAWSLVGTVLGAVILLDIITLVNAIFESNLVQRLLRK